MPFIRWMNILIAFAKKTPAVFEIKPGKWNDNMLKWRGSRPHDMYVVFHGDV